MLEAGIEHVTLYIVEVNIDAFGTSIPEVPGEVGRGSIDPRVESEIVDELPDLALPAGNADDARTANPRDLPRNRSDRPGCRRHDHGLAGLWLRDIHNSEIRGQSIAAEDAERQPGIRARIARPDLIRIDDRLLAPIQQPRDQVAFAKLGMGGLDDDRDPASAQRLPDQNGRGRSLAVLVHPFAHGRRIAESDRPGMDLPGLQRAKRHGLKPEIVGLSDAMGSSCQHPSPGFLAHLIAYRMKLILPTDCSDSRSSTESLRRIEKPSLIRCRR